MKAPPTSTKASLTSRLTSHARTHWPAWCGSSKSRMVDHRNPAVVERGGEGLGGRLGDGQAVTSVVRVGGCRGRCVSRRSSSSGGRGRSRVPGVGGRRWGR